MMEKKKRLNLFEINEPNPLPIHINEIDSTLEEFLRKIFDHITECKEHAEEISLKKWLLWCLRNSENERAGIVRAFL